MLVAQLGIPVSRRVWSGTGRLCSSFRSRSDVHIS